MISELLLPWDFTGRILLAGALGALFGIERDLHARPAGLRTSMLVCMGCCLFGIISSDGFMDAGGTPDPTRIASIVVQGIGFLGAGVLLKGDEKIVGLTTATTIWMVAAVGLAVGAGMVKEAIFVAGVALVSLVALGPVSNRLETYGNARMKKRGQNVVKEE